MNQMASNDEHSISSEDEQDVSIENASVEVSTAKGILL